MNTRIDQHRSALILAAACCAALAAYLYGAVFASDQLAVVDLENGLALAPLALGDGSGWVNGLAVAGDDLLIGRWPPPTLLRVDPASGERLPAPMFEEPLDGLACVTRPAAP